MALSLILPAHVAASTTTDDPKYTNWTALILCQAIAIIITGSIDATALEHDMAGINSFSLHLASSMALAREIVGYYDVVVIWWCCCLLCNCPATVLGRVCSKLRGKVFGDAKRWFVPRPQEYRGNWAGQGGARVASLSQSLFGKSVCLAPGRGR